MNFKKIATWGVPVAIVIVLLMSYFSLSNGVLTRETEMTARYSDVQNYYSNFRSQFATKFGLSQANVASIDMVLKDYVTGKTDNANTLVVAMKAMVPNTDNVSRPYTDLMNYVTQARNEFRDKQSAMIDDASSYRRYTLSQPRKLVIDLFVHAPTDNLQAIIGNQTITGKAALKKMMTPITTADTQENFRTGTDTPDLPQTGKQ